MTKFLFRQDNPLVAPPGLGDNAVRCIALHHMMQAWDLDARIVAPHDERYLPLWCRVFGDRVTSNPAEVPIEFERGYTVSATPKTYAFGLTAWTVFASVLWECGFLSTSRLRIDPPKIFRCDPESRAAMIYPCEFSGGNTVHTSNWWLAACEVLRRAGYKLNLLGDKSHAPLADFFSQQQFDAEFPPTIDGMADCAAASSIAIGGSTGPSWAMLMSDIRQVCLESHQAVPIWYFDRCRHVIVKPLKLVTNLNQLPGAVS